MKKLQSCTFTVWLQKLKCLLNVTSISTKDWIEYYRDGYSPEEAYREDCSYEFE